MTRIMIFLAGLLAVSGCVSSPPPGQAPEEQSSGRVSFAQVARQIEPVAERECRARLTLGNCDFLIRIETDPRAGLNAFQTLDQNGRPIILVTSDLIAAVRNADELALVIGHEAAHHIHQHIPVQVDAARRGALVFGVLAQMSGANEAEIDEAVQMGAAVGVQRYSQGHELEADQLGTIITARAGFDPVQGALFFNRLPEPGNRLYSTHPPHRQRQQMIRQTAAGL